MQREIPSRDILWQEGFRRERYFPTRSGRESVKRRTADRRGRKSYLTARSGSDSVKRDYSARRTKREKKRERGRFFCSCKHPNEHHPTIRTKKITNTNQQKTDFPPSNRIRIKKNTHHSIPIKMLERERIPGSWITPETRNTNTLLEKDGRERCRPVETTPMKDERPAREEREGEREKERCVGRENEKNYPSQHVLAF